MPIAVGAKRIDVNAAGGNQTTVGQATQAAGSIFVIGGVYDVGTFTSLGDNKGNTYTQIGSEVSIGAAGARGRWYYVQNGVGGAGHTCSIASTSSNCAAWILELTGAALTSALGVSNQIEDTSSPFTSPSIAPASVNGILVAFHVGISVTSPATHAETGLGSSTIQLDNTDPNIWPMAVATAIKSPASGSYNSSWTENGNTTAAAEHIAFFLELVAGESAGQAVPLLGQAWL